MILSHFLVAILWKSQRTCLSLASSLQSKKERRKEGNNPFPALFSSGGFVLSRSFSSHEKLEENKLNSGTPSRPCCGSRFDLFLRDLLPSSNYLVQKSHTFYTWLNHTEHISHYPRAPYWQNQEWGTEGLFFAFSDQDNAHCRALSGVHIRYKYTCTEPQLEGRPGRIFNQGQH